MSWQRRLEGVDITQMGYLCQKRLSERGKKVTEEDWKLFYSVLCGQTLRFYRDQRYDKDSEALYSPPDGQADPDQLTQAGFLDVHNCLLRMDYKSQRQLSAQGGERKNIFSLTTSDMSEYLFQGPSQLALMSWVARIQESLDKSKEEDEVEDDESNDQLDALENIIKKQVGVAAKKSRRVSLRTRNVLSLVRQGPAITTSEERAEFEAKCGSLPRFIEEPDESSEAVEPRLSCLHEQLYARQQLLEQLEEQERLFLGSASSRDAEATTTPGGLERCTFVATAKQDFYLVPGHLSSAVSSGDKLTVFGRSKNGQWRCHVHRSGLAILRCAASGKPGYDVKSSDDSEASSSGAEKSATRSLAGKKTSRASLSRWRSHSEPPDKEAATMMTMTKRPSTNKPRRPEIEITTSATTITYPMLGAIPSSLIAELAGDQLVTSEEQEAESQSKTSGKKQIHKHQQLVGNLPLGSFVAAPLRRHQFQLPTQARPAGIAFITGDSSSDEDGSVSSGDDFDDERTLANGTGPLRIFSSIDEGRVDDLEGFPITLQTRRPKTSQADNAREIMKRLEKQASNRAVITSPTSSISSVSSVSSVSSSSVKPPLNEMRTIRLQKVNSDNIGMSLMHYEDRQTRAPQVFVATVSEAARKSGIVVGDVILEVNGNSVESLFPDEVMYLIVKCNAEPPRIKVKFMDGLQRYNLQEHLRELDLALQERMDELQELCRAEASILQKSTASCGTLPVLTVNSHELENGLPDGFAVLKRNSDGKKIRRTTSSVASQTLSAALLDKALLPNSNSGEIVRHVDTDSSDDENPAGADDNAYYDELETEEAAV